MASLTTAMFGLAVLIALTFASDLQVPVSTCSKPLYIIGNKYAYDLSPLIGAVISATSGPTGYKISICSSDLGSCGLCNQTGFCEVEQWYSNCVGQFVSAYPSVNGTKVTLVYGSGEFGRQGVVDLICDLSADPFGPVTIAQSGNLAVVPSRYACAKPVGPPPPPPAPCGSHTTCDSCTTADNSCLWCVYSEGQGAGGCLDVRTLEFTAAVRTSHH